MFNKDLADRCLLKGMYWNGVVKWLASKKIALKLMICEKTFKHCLVSS